MVNKDGKKVTFAGNGKGAEEKRKKVSTVSWKLDPRYACACAELSKCRKKRRRRRPKKPHRRPKKMRRKPKRQQRRPRRRRSRPRKKDRREPRRQ